MKSLSRPQSTQQANKGHGDGKELQHDLMHTPHIRAQNFFTNSARRDKLALG